MCNKIIILNLMSIVIPQTFDMDCFKQNTEMIHPLKFFLNGVKLQ